MRLLLLLLCAEVVCAQPRSFPVVSLKVEGNRIYSSERILAAAGLRIGEPATREKFEAARQRLMDSGFFESVGYKYGPSSDKQGYAASFEVAEVQQAYPVKFERLSRPAEELRALLAKADPLFGDRVPGTEPILKRYAGVLQKHLNENIVGRVTAEGPDQLSIVFQPAQGPPAIAEVRFENTTVLPASTLQNAIAGTAIGTVWDEKKFRQLLDASIRPLYEARGRLQVAFPKVATEPFGGEVQGVRVRVEVSEGETFTLGDVVFDDPPIPEPQLRKAAAFKKDDLANFDEVNSGLDRMRQMFRRNGYLDARVIADRKLDEAKKQVSLTIRFEPGRRYTFSKLNIVGLDIISEPPIRKAFAMKEGQPFNPEYPDQFLNRIREERVFDNLGKTRSEIKMDKERGTAEVTLYFR